MGDRSGIEWTDATWNPVVGCSRVSPGCDHCYAETQSVRNQAMSSLGYEGVTERDTSGAWHWTGRINTAPAARFDAPLRWARPRRIFVNSMSDLFHDGVTRETILEVFDIMRRCPQHQFQLLTKRPQRMKAMMTERLATPAEVSEGREFGIFPGIWDEVSSGVPLSNVWLGVSVESQSYAWRCRHLLETPAAVRWVSAEPLLGAVSLMQYMAPSSDDSPRLDWVVCGGESGVGARMMHPLWARLLRDECGAVGVPFLFKQWGSWCPEDVLLSSGYDGSYATAFAEGGVTMVRPRSKRDAGRMLDGRLWDGYPHAGRMDGTLL